MKPTENLSQYVVRRSLGGRRFYVEGPADLRDGACFGRDVICESNSYDRAILIAVALNRCKHCGGEVYDSRHIPGQGKRHDYEPS